MKNDVRSSGRTFVRTVIVVALAAVVLVCAWPNLIVAARGESTVAFDLANDFVVRQITPGSAADVAGLLVGDRVDLRSLPLYERVKLAGFAPLRQGETLRFDVIRNGTRLPIVLAGEKSGFSPWSAILKR